MFTVATCYLIAHSFSCSRLFFWSDSICFSWPFKGVLSTCSTRELLPAERHKLIPYRSIAFEDQGKFSKGPCSILSLKKSCNIDIILYCSDRDNLKYSNSSIKLLNSPPRYFLINWYTRSLVMFFCGFAHFLPHHCLLQECKGLCFRREDLSGLPLSGLFIPCPMANRGNINI